MSVAKSVWPSETPVELAKFFGNIEVDSEGMPTQKWLDDHLALVKCPWTLVLSWDHSKTASGIKCNKLVAASLAAVLDEIWVRHQKNASLIAQSRLHLYGGCFEFRRKRGLAGLSMHSYGAAIDLDPEGNPLGATWQPGTGMMSDIAIAVFKEAGWKWGGDFKGRKDPMHFQATS